MHELSTVGGRFYTLVFCDNCWVGEEAAMWIIVVSLTCTSYLCGALLTLQVTGSYFIAWSVLKAKFSKKETQGWSPAPNVGSLPCTFSAMGACMPYRLTDSYFIVWILSKMELSNKEVQGLSFALGLKFSLSSKNFFYNKLFLIKRVYTPQFCIIAMNKTKLLT